MTLSTRNPNFIFNGDRISVAKYLYGLVAELESALDLATNGGYSGGVVGSFACASDLAVRDAVYVSASGTVAKATNTNAGTLAMGFIVQKPTATTCVVLSSGEISGFSGLTAGAPYYLATNGGITSTVPTIGTGVSIQQIGVAKTSTVLSASVDPSGGIIATLANGGNATNYHYHTALFSSGYNTSGLATGDVVYANTGAQTLGKVDATTEAKTHCLGVYTGISAVIQTSGIVQTVNFTTAGGSPSNGAYVYIADGTVDTGIGTGAGKLSAVMPGSGAYKAIVGICVDNGQYASAKTCKVELIKFEPSLIA